MKFKRTLQSILLSLILLLLAGCRAKLASGLYVGTLYRMEANRFSQSPVSIQVDRRGPYSADLKAKDIHRMIIDQGHIDWDKWKDQISLTLPWLHLNSFQLNRIPSKVQSDIHWRCYQGGSSLALSLCLSRKSMMLNATNVLTKELVYSLSADLSAHQATLSLEIPRSYTLSEAIELVESKSFEAQIEYQRLLQAKEAARAAYFNLLPHVSSKTILAASPLSPKGMVNFVMDLAPFVIPTRWLKAREAREMREAEKVTLEILKADLVNQISGLSYLYVEDQMNLIFYQNLLKISSEVLGHARKINPTESSASTDSPGFADARVLDEISFRLSIVMNIMEQEILRLENSLSVHKASLAISLGLLNPEAVTDIDLEEDSTSIETAEELVEQEINQAAIERSLELWQLDHLIHNAQLQKEEYYFNLADPSVAPSMGASLSLIPYVAKAQALINEFLKRREQTQSQILNKAQNAVSHYNFTLRRYQLLKVGQDSLFSRIHQILQDILAAKNPQDLHSTGADLQWTLQTYIQNQLSAHSIITEYRIARSQIQRLLLERYFTRHQRPTKPFQPLLKES